MRNAILCRIYSEGIPKITLLAATGNLTILAFRQTIVLTQMSIYKGWQYPNTKQLWAEVFEALHSANQGVNGMIANARQQLFWPILDASIRQTRTQCQTCNSFASSQPREHLMSPPNSEIPFQKMVTDFFNLHGQCYMVYADWYTGWVKVTLLTSAKAKKMKYAAGLVLHIQCTRRHLTIQLPWI